MIKLAVTGAKGQVGTAVCQRAQEMGIEVVAFDADNLNLSDKKQIHTQLSSSACTYLINCASYSVVDLAQVNPEEAYRINQVGAKHLAQVCAQLAIPLLHLSTDYVFDSDVHEPIAEHHPAKPANVFGASKLEGEAAIVEHWHKHIILRVGWIFSAQGNNFVLRTLRQIRSQEEVFSVDDQWGCPTYAFDVARVLLAIVLQVDCNINVWGIYHYSGAEIVTWKSFAETILAAVKPLPNTVANKIVPVSSQNWRARAPRPTYSVLDCQCILDTFGIRQRPWRSGLVKVINTLGNNSQIDLSACNTAKTASVPHSQKKAPTHSAIMTNHLS